MKTNLSLKDELLSAIRRIVAKFWAQEVGQLIRLQSVGYHAKLRTKIGIRSRIGSRMLLSTLLMLTVCIGNAWGADYIYSFTINSSDFNTKSYAANNNEKTSTATCTTDPKKTMSVKWTSNQVMKNGSNMQWQKSNGYIYNSTDLGTINSITVTSSAGSFTNYYGTTEHPTSGTTVGNGFFTVKVGSATGTTSQIVINFTISEGGGSTPTITTSVSSLSEVGYSTADFSQQVKSFTVSGSSLTANVTVTAPTNYEVCKTSGGTYTSSVTFDKGSGTLAASTVYVRLQSGKTAGNYSGDISCTSTGATTKNVAASGSVPFTVTWKANGTTHATTYVTYATGTGTALGSLPDDPDPSDYTCSPKAFYGWYDGASYSDASVAPSVISTSTKITTDKTYNAVFATASGGGEVTWNKVTTSISAGDIIVLVNETASKELTSIGLISTTYCGIASDYSTTPNGTFPLAVETGNGGTGFSFKNGTNYLSWSSGNSLAASATKDDASSWTVNNPTSGNFTFSNVGTTDRKLQYNSGSPRFCCYTSSQTVFQIYKRTTSYTWSNYATSCCTELPAPTNPNETPSNEGGTLYWDAVTGATGYEVNIDGGGWVSTGNGTTCNYTVTGKACGGTSVSWQVRATGSGSNCETGAATAIRNFSTTSCSCTGTYSFHYQHSGSWNAENICFSSVTGATNNYLTDELHLPYAENYKVAWQGADQSYTSSTGFSGNMPFFHNRDKKFGVNPQNGNIGGGKGKFHVYHDSGSTNKYISFIPTGYTLNFGTGDTWVNDLTMNFTGKTNNWNETEWYTDLVTLTNAQIEKKIFVGLQTNSGYVWCDPYSQKDNLTGLRTKTGADSWLDGGMSTSYAEKTGKFRIYANSGDKNWYVTFVPYFRLTYDANSGTGAPSASEYVCCEGNNAARTIAISSTEPTRDGYRFMGWANTAEKAAAGTVDYKYGTASDDVVLTGSLTLFAVWKQLYAVTYAYAGGSGSCAGGSYIEGETVTVCASTPTKAGSTFNGWSYSPSVTVTTGQFTMPSSNVVITATWIEASYALNHNGSNYTNTEGKTTIKSSDTPLTLNYTCTGTYAFPLSISITGGGKASWTVNTDYTWTVDDNKQAAQLVIASTSITADVTIIITMKTRYTVVWDEHGSTTTEYYATDDNNVAMKGDIDDCGEKKFYGWTENEEFVSNPTTPPTMASSGAISGNKHYYAIFADAEVPANPGYNKVNTISAGTYIIASANYAYKAVTSHVDASPSDGVISSLPTGATEVLVELGTGTDAGYFAISYDNNGTKTYIKGANKDLSTQTSAIYDWSLDISPNEGEIKSKGQSGYYLQQNTANGDFKAYGHTQTIAYLYKKQTTSYSNFAKTCALYDITITTPSGGEVTTTPAAGTGVAGEGQTVTVNVTPNSCKYLSALKYNDGSDHAISIASTPYTFTMPASDVTVTATFADKSVSSIAANTSTHRTLMQNTSFVGEQIRVTFDNGETEDLAWDASGLTFSGYDMSTLGNQTVSVAYVGSCGSANTSYSIEITDGIPVTFSDCGNTTVRKYEPGDVVPVETTAGEYACSGWEFVGWSESSVAANSTSFTPVRNFNASTARTLYAVYAHIRKDGSSNDLYESADMVADLQEGARYVVAYFTNSNDGISSGLTGMLPTVASTYYLSGTSSFAGTEDRNASNSYVYHSTATIDANAHWQLMLDGTGYWQLYNKSANKYLDLSGHTNGYIGVSTSPVGKIVIGNYTESVGDNDSRLEIKYNGCSDPHYVSWKRGDYFNQYSSGKVFMMTKDEYFSSNPPCAPQSAVFHGNGGTVIASGGSPTGDNLTIRETIRDGGITTPTAEYAACDGKSWTFVGWADHEVDVTRVPILTTELLNDGGGNKAHTITTDGEEFWAIYTNQGEPMTKYGTISFSMSDVRLDYHTDETEVTKTVAEMGDYTFGYKRVGHQSQTGIQLESGTGEFYNKTSLGKINSISFNTFVVGGINNLKVYVGDASKATTYELTAGERQTNGSVVTYYPAHDCEYVYIKNFNSYVCVEGISIDFGQGTTIYATTPNCKRITLSGDIYATSTNGRGIMAVAPLHVNAYQLDASAGIVISSNSSDVYFSTDRNANFVKAASSQPKNSVTVNAGLDGSLSTDVYVHYKPSSDGDGIPADVTVTANLSSPDPSVTASRPIHVRNMPAKFVIAAKVGGAYYALPADMDAATNPEGVLIAVNEVNMTATAPESCSYTIWPVKTTNGEYDRYASNTVHYDGNAFGDRVRFSAVNNSNKGLWANNSNSENTIRNYAAITSASDGGTTENTNPAYEWIITTTIADGKWQYTLQTAQTQNDRNLRYWTAASGGPKWGTYVSGEQNLYLLPVTEVTPFDAKVTEWGKNSAVFDVYPKVDETLANKVIAYLGASNSGAKDVTETTTSVKGTSSKYNYTINFGNDIDFSANEGATLRLDWKNNETLLGYSVIVIPTIIAEDANLHDIDEYKTHWESKDVHVLPGNTLTVDAGSFENHSVTIGTLEIYPGATVKVTKGSAESGTLTATNLILRNGWTRAGSKSYDVARLYIPSEGTLNATNVYSDWYIDFDQYYPIAVPWNVTVANMSYLNSNNAASDGVKLRYYDGDSRATNVQSGVGESANWKEYGATGNLSIPATLTPGVGYAMTAKRPTGKAFSIIRMPLTIPSAAWTTGGEQGSVTVDDVTTHKDQVSVTAHGDDNTPTYAKGWNLIANPYMSLYNGTLSYGENNTIAYANIPDINFQEYSQVPINNTTNLKPSSAFLVQAPITGTATFATGSRVAAAPSYRNAGTATTPTQKAYIVLADEQMEDMMGILVSEKYTADYELNADLEKLLSDGNTLRTYMRYNDMNMAYLAINEELAKQLIPVSVRIPAEGEYTFRIHEASIADELEGIYLTDYQTNTVTNLLYDSYTFNAVAGTDNVRFAINAVIGKREVPTGVDISGSDKDGPTKFIYHDKVYILHNNVIYDSTGKRVNVINK